MRRVAWVLMALMACTVVGCEDDPPPIPPRDAGPRSDAGVDAATVTPDGAVGVDGAVRRDAGDITRFDAGPMDAGPVVLPPDPCESMTPPGCGAGCEPGFVCVSGVCGGMECVVGRACITMNPECEGMPDGGVGGGPPDGAVIPDAGVFDAGAEECENSCGGAMACLEAEDGNRYCDSSTNTCTASSECALGFACESGSCVDRRVPCGIVSDGCPRGYVCSNALRRGPAFCVSAQGGCESTSQCETGASCLDVAGDSNNECQFSGVCQTNADCSGAGMVCGVHPQTTATMCVSDGPCSGSEDCGEGFTCVDLAGTGSTRCEYTAGGSCTANADCDAGQVCASPREIDPVRCIGNGMGA